MQVGDSSPTPIPSNNDLLGVSRSLGRQLCVVRDVQGHDEIVSVIVDDAAIHTIHQFPWVIIVVPTQCTAARQAEQGGVFAAVVHQSHSDDASRDRRPVEYFLVMDFDEIRTVWRRPAVWKKKLPGHSVIDLIGNAAAVVFPATEAHANLHDERVVGATRIVSRSVAKFL